MSVIEPLLCGKRPDQPCGYDGGIHNYECYVSACARDIEEEREEKS